MTTKNNKKYAPLETQTHNRLIVSQAIYHWAIMAID